MISPFEEPELPARFRGLPVIAPGACAEDCAACVEACPTAAFTAKGPLLLDLGRCVFCAECAGACPEGKIRFTRDHRMAASLRGDLVVSPGAEPRLARALDERMRSLFARSLKLRHVSAGGCNGCEAELAATREVVFDLGRFGIELVASPRQADGLVVTGPVTDNMREALESAYAAVPAPKIVIAVGACAISGGPFFDSPVCHGGTGSILPVDLFIPGCPPHPHTILDGLLRMLGKLEDGGRERANELGASR